MSNITALKKQAEELLAKFYNGKCYAIGDLHNRLQKTAADYPQDTVILAVAHVIEDINYKQPQKIISQAEFESIYNQLVGLNISGTRFREVLGDLLKTEAPKIETSNEKFVQAMRDDTSKMDIEYDVDKEVKQGFDRLFGTVSDKYDPQLASMAKGKVALELKSIGYVPRIKLAGGNARFLVFATDFDTNRGAVRVFIPAEASGDTFPSVFVAGNKFADLNSSNIQEYIQSAASREEQLPAVSTVLHSLDILTGNVKKAEQDGKVSQITNKLAENGSEYYSSPELFGTMPDLSKTIKDVELPRVATPEPLKMLASEIEENVLETSVGFTQDVVRLAKRMLSIELNSMGFVNSQVRVTAPTPDGFICEATINTPRGKVSIEVPIEIKNNCPLLPSVFAKDDFVDDFTTQKLHLFAMRDDVMVNTAVNRTSPLFEMTLSQLKDVIVRAASKNDFDTCNEAIDIVAANFDDEVHRIVVADYLQMLVSFGSAQSNIRQAYDDSDQFVRTASSIYPIHKKLGRPVQDLVRDENGEYHLKSTYYARKAQEAEGVLFNTAKILVGE